MAEYNSYSPLNSLRLELERPPLLFKDRCIYRVPKRLRDVNDNAYTPKVVSIGPFHHGNQNLKPMEDHKKRYLRHYLQHTHQHMNYYVKIIKGKENELRSCYAETIPFSSDEFVMIILLDAIFIIEILLVKYGTGINVDHDHIFHRPWRLIDITPDLLLLENQLPFFIFEDLFNPVQSYLCPDEPISIAKLAHSFLKRRTLVSNREGPEGHSDSYRTQHFLDLFRISVLPPEQNFGTETTSNLQSPTNRRDQHEIEMTFLRNHPQSSDVSERNSHIKSKMKNSPNLPSATKLHQAGVKFKVMRTSKNLLDIQFTFSQGILEIPILKLGDGVIHWNDEDNHFAVISHELRMYYGTRWHKWNANLRQNYFHSPWAIISLIAAVLLIILTLIQAVCSVISVVKH
ncbi:hypothetical protein F8388_022166 [Cannabis sativa]|uniref:Uncharacterized protein n=1 Tax=Cannabis sativa TaxID=3483 RepID=A0A7J6GAE7_CANSA|nr:hypothetical protein F8388_022166 [Cannabis sativa]